MKILHVAQFLGIGGLEKIIYHLAKRQLLLGHEVSVYIYDWEQTWVPFFRESGINVITPELKKDGYDFNLLKRIKRDINNYDIVHTHDLNPLMYIGLINLWKKLLFKSKPKLIHTTHGLDHLENYPKAPLYEQYFSPMADAIVGVSQNICDYYTHTVRISSKKIFRIDNGVDVYAQQVTDMLRAKHRQEICQRYNLDPQKPILITVARIVPLKDQKFLMDTVTECEDIQLLVVGPSGDNQYYATLQKAQNSRVILTGGRSDIAEHLLASDLFVSASTHEGIPVAVLEAMGTSTASLVSDIPGHSIINTLTPNSIETFALGNKKDFIQKMKNILKNKSIQKELIQRGKSAVINHYSVEAMTDKYIKVYEETLC